MNYLLITLLAIASYLLGSIPSGYLIVKYVKKTDIRSEGSNSTGATNTTRVLGLKYGILALVFDALKGIIIMSILVIFNLTHLYIIKGVNILAVYGLLAVIGHVYPIFLNFKGGKAVATSFGVLFFLTPVLGVLGIFLFITIVSITRYVSVASILSAILLVLAVIISAVFDIKIFTYMATPRLDLMPWEYAVTLSILATLIVFRHKDNIKRLKNGNENKFTFKKKNEK